MKIILNDTNDFMCSEWENVFASDLDVSIFKGQLKDLLNTKEKIDTIVSPANSYGLMDGTYDLAIINYFGEELMKDVQEYILKHYCGEQPICSSFIINIPNTNKRLIHTPTMRVPSVIKEKLIVYHCMRSTLLLAKKKKVKNIVIPAFGAGCGQVDKDEVAYLMKEAYDQIKNPPKKLDWDYASKRSYLNDLER